MTILQTLFLMLSGVGAGLIGALFGLGGGILIVPILVLILGVPMHNAVAASLMCVVATSSAAASRNVSRGVANVHLGMALEMWTVGGSIVGSFVAGLLPGRVLMLIFAAAMILMSIPMARNSGQEETAPQDDGSSIEETPFTSRLRGEYFDPASNATIAYRVRRFPLAAGVSSLAGVVSGLLGVGGGILKVPVLTVYCGVPMKAAAATSNFVIGVTAVAGAVVYYGRGQMLPAITGATVIGVFLGSRAGASLAPHLHGRTLRRAFAVVMIAIALQMLWRALP